MKTSVAVIAAIASAFAAGPALAHPEAGVAASFAAGFTHPLTGLDHLLAMVAAGFWAASSGRAARALAPAAFLAAMAAGAALAIGGFTVPFVEFGIAGSVLLLGLLIACAPRLPAAAVAALVGLFALAHGHAHGVEMPLAASAAIYGAGFAAATALLLGAGLALAAVRVAPRLAGGGLAAAGLALVMAV